MKKKTNWWVILAIIIIGIPIGYVVMFFLTHSGEKSEQGKEPDSPEQIESFLKIDNSRFVFENDGGQKDFAISSNVDWQLDIDEESKGWLAVSPTKGHGDKFVDLEVAQNDDTSERHAVVTVRWEDENANEQEKMVEITQHAKEEPIPVVIDGPTPPEPSPSANYLSLLSTRVSFTMNGGTKSVSVKSNTDWTVAVSGGEWLSVTPLSGSRNNTITISAESNTSTDSRTASLAFTWNDDQGQSRRSVVNVTQPGLTPQPAAFLNISPSEVAFSPNAGSRIVSISSNTDWTVSVSDRDWIRVNATSGSRNKTLTLRASKNTTAELRSATLNVTWSNENGESRSATVNISQDFVPGPKSLTTEEASQIIQAGMGNDKIPNTCLIICNGESMQYLNFSRQVRNRAFWNIKVTKVECDAMGVPVKIMVSADSETEN